MQVPPMFYKSTNIVLHENHKGICSGQMVPTPKIYGIGSWTITAAGVVPCGGPKKSPRTSSIVQIILFL